MNKDGNSASLVPAPEGNVCGLKHGAYERIDGALSDGRVEDRQGRPLGPGTINDRCNTPL